MSIGRQLYTHDRTRWTTKREACPACHTVSRVRIDPKGGIKCWVCLAYTPPEGDRDRSDSMTLGLPAVVPPREIPNTDILDSLAYLTRCRDCGAFEELAARLECEGSLSRTDAESQAAHVLGLNCSNSNNPMHKIIEEEPSLLRKESVFAALITELTRPTILSEWDVGLARDGSTIFWYADQCRQFQNAKTIRYHSNGWNRIRDDRHPPLFLYPGNPIPLYGAWQLSASDRRPFALFESEKTAIVASVHLPQYICLAVGGHNLSEANRASVLRGRNGIILFDREPETIIGAETAARTIRASGATVEVEDLRQFYPSIPPNWDLADVIYEQYLQWKRSHIPG